MSRLYINDLESIKNGKLVKYNFGYKDNSKEINLHKLNEQIKDLRYIRNYILEKFKNDVKNEFDNIIGSRIDEHKNIDFDPKMLFLSKYLFLTIPTMFGDTTCLVSEHGIENASFNTPELEKKLNLIFPYIRGILHLKEKSNVLDNRFYNDIYIYDSNSNKVLVLNGDGIFLPFRNYFDLDENLPELLFYYYQNLDSILENINVPDGEILDVYRTNVSKQKALAIYKGIE